MTLDTTVKEKEEKINLETCLVKIRVKYTAKDGALHFYSLSSFISS